jgi:hypothetical protein
MSSACAVPMSSMEPVFFIKKRSSFFKKKTSINWSEMELYGSWRKVNVSPIPLYKATIVIFTT